MGEGGRLHTLWVREGYERPSDTSCALTQVLDPLPHPTVTIFSDQGNDEAPLLVGAQIPVISVQALHRRA